MRTRNYSDLLELIQALCGVVFASIELGRINAFVNRRINRAYRASDYWTRFLVVGEERPVNDGVVSFVDDVRSGVFVTGILSPSGANGFYQITGVDPFDGLPIYSKEGYKISRHAYGPFMSQTEAWGISGDTGLISQLFFHSLGRSDSPAQETVWNNVLGTGTVFVLDASSLPSKEDIDTFLRIHKDQPYSNVAVQEYDFSVGPDGAKLVSGTLDPSVAYVTYKAVLPDSYGQDSTEIPAEWFQYIAHGVYADYLRAEGQQEKAALADQEAIEILTDELMRAENVSTQNLVATRFLTNANMQMRYT